MNWGKVGLFAGGVLFGTAGIKILTSRDAKKVYAFTTAAALRAKEAVMTTATNIREGADDILAVLIDAGEQSAADDILADAKALNEKYAAEDAPETIEDAAE